MTYQGASIASAVEHTVAIMYSGIGRKIRIKSVNNLALRCAFIGLKSRLTGKAHISHMHDIPFH
jgi:hypothetical protein